MSDAASVGRPRSRLPQGVEPNAFALWLADAELDVASIARVLGVSRPTVYRWRRGTGVPSLDMAIRVELLSGGVVSTKSWRQA